MKLSLRLSASFVCLIVVTFTACNSSKESAKSGGSAKGPAAGGPPSAAGGQQNLSSHAVTIHKMTAEMVNLMDDVSTRKIMHPPLKVSDVRNAFLERLDWLDEMSTDDVTKLRQATADLDALIAEIRAHENAQGDSALEARLKKIEDWNQSIKDGLPK